jgi:hypothetical protein
MALEHREPDRVPLELGGGPTSSMHVSSVYALRQALKLDPPGTPVKVVEPFQMLGEIKPDLLEALGVDLVPLWGRRTFFGYCNEGWKPWTTFDGTPVLVPAGFNTQPDAEGNILQYPEGDLSAPPSGKMPKDGWYFDAIIRQPPLDDAHLKVEDNLEEFGPISDAELEYFAREARRLFDETDKAVFANFGGTSFGDIALVPGTQLKHPRGIRDVEEWYVSTVARRDYVYEVFSRQCDVALANLERIYAAVGDRVSIAFVSGTDFGAQNAPFISRQAYRSLFKPFHLRVNRWIHEHTAWKTLIHSCGSVVPLIPEFIEAGFDILNPVQTSAAQMEPARLKQLFGDNIVFLGGGIDTQRTLPFGTPDQVRQEARERIQLFGRGGGFVFNSVHNVQARTPAGNLTALYQAVRDYGKYPL